MNRWVSAALAVILLFVSAQAPAAPELEGKIVSAGSDTLGALSSLWAERLREEHPRVLVQVRAIGSGAAPTSLVQGAADIGPMSRPMSDAEQELFFRRYGYAPTAVPVAYDQISIFVHRSNPVATLTIEQLDAVFSSTRRCGFPRLVRDWSELGVDARQGGNPISLYGRGAASGTYSVFREQVLCGGDFAPRLNRLVGSSAIVRAVAQDPGGVGYASAGHVNATVKPLGLLDAEGRRARPLSRALFLYLNRPPGADLGPLVGAYVRLALSTAGQQEVLRSGYTPLSRQERDVLLRDLGLADD
ncbi:MAG: PstS family phosphate ABC transporter substrate-binding protein [Pseudomonadota bacterium]